MPPKKPEPPKKQQPKPVITKVKDKQDGPKVNQKEAPGSKVNKPSPEKDNKNTKSIQKLGKETDKKGSTKDVGKAIDTKNTNAKGGDKNNLNDAKKDPKPIQKDKKELQRNKSVEKLDVKGKKGEQKDKKDEKGKKGEVKEAKQDKRARGRSLEKEAKSKDNKDKGTKDVKDKGDKGVKEKDKKLDPKSSRGNEKSPKGKNTKQINVIVKPKQEEDIIKQSGLLQAYQLFLRAVCRHGLPDGNVYEFAAQQIEKYERKKHAQELKAKAQQQIEKAARRREERERMQSIDND